MLVSTSRYAGPKAKELAQSLAAVSGSVYCARGKKTVETLVSLSRKKGENTLALVFPDRISFISVSVSSWKWKKQSILVRKYQLHAPEEGEIASISGADAPLFSDLFGISNFHYGEISVHAEKGRLEFFNEKKMLEIEYEVISDEEPHGVDA